MREFKLDPVHFQVLATLLHRHLRSETNAMEGRVILTAVFENSFEVLQGMQVLGEESPLRESGLVVLEEDEDCPEDILEARFRISEEALTTFREEIAGLVVHDQANTRIQPYGHNREYLADLRILHNLYRLRSDRVFHQERWDRVHGAADTPGGYTSRRIQSYWNKIGRRLTITPEVENFSALRFFKEHNLLAEEVIIVMSLLFQELYEGNAYADAADLIRLVSTNELELMRNRRLMQKGSNLIKHEMIKIETMLEGRELTGEVCLSDWVVNYIFGANAQDLEIASDERLDWHLYLKNLGDTRSFFRDLEAN